MSELKLTCPICKVAPKASGGDYCPECSNKIRREYFHKAKQKKALPVVGYWNSTAKQRAAARKKLEAGRVMIPVSQLLGSEK